MTERSEWMAQNTLLAASDVVVHNISSCMLQLESDGAWQPFVGGEDGLRVNMYTLPCFVSTTTAQTNRHAKEGYPCLLPL